MLKRVLILLPGATLCLALAVPAVAQEKPGDTKIVVKDDTTPKVKKGAKAVSDASVTTAVKTRLMKDKVARGTSIDVSTKDGIVTIAGNVPTAADKTRIGHLVERTTGVKAVENNLAVTGNAATGTSGAKEGDTKIVIKDDTPKIAVKKDDTKIEVKDDAPKVKVKDDTTPMVKKGAEKTKNAAKKTGAAIADASKKTGEFVSDGSINTAVKTRLMKDPAARATHIDVDTKDGVVTIGGTVPTEADKTRIGALVERTTGVKSVVNNLTVK